MNIKKNATPDWLIAVMYYLAAIVVVPFIWGFLLDFAFQSLQPDVSTAEYIRIIAGAVFVFVGVMYSSRYFNKTYSISNPKSIINISTAYLIVIDIVFYLNAFATNNITTNVDNIILDVVSKLLVIGVFYYSSKKYLKHS